MVIRVIFVRNQFFLVCHFGMVNINYFGIGKRHSGQEKVSGVVIEITGTLCLGLDHCLSLIYCGDLLVSRKNIRESMVLRYQDGLFLTVDSHEDGMLGESHL